MSFVNVVVYLEQPFLEERIIIRVDVVTKCLIAYWHNYGTAENTIHTNIRSRHRRPSIAETGDKAISL